VDYVDEHLFTKYLYGSHVDTFHVDVEIHVGSRYFEDEILRFIEEVETLNTKTHDLTKFRVID